MLKTAIFATVFGALVGALIKLPKISINVDAVVASSAFEYIRAAMYFFPVKTVAAILGLILALWIFRIVVAFVKTIWDLLPVA